MGRVIPPVGSGLSYLDVNGHLVTEDMDVCDYKARLREIDPTLAAYFDEEQEEWIVTARDSSNTEYFILADRDLGRAYEGVLLARNDRPGALTGNQLDDKLAADQKRAQFDDNQAFREIGEELGERLLHAFKKDGILDHDNIYGPKPRRHLARRDVRIR